VPHHDLAWLEERGVGAPDAVSNILVELIRNAATDIVGLEAGKIIHGDLVLG
jgi:hypothetical protein